MTYLVPEEDITYTKTEQKIAEYIEKNTNTFLFMSIGALAQELGTSEATISRFARHVGYQDFKEMKSGIAQQKSDMGPARKIASTLLKDQGFDITRWFAMQQQCLEKTLSQLDLEEFNDAIGQIQQAGRIFIHAKNASASAGELLFFRLRRLGYDVQLIPSGGSEVVEGIAHAGKGDVVIFFSYAKLSRESRFILEYAKQIGFTTIAFTSRVHAPQNERASYNLYVYRGEEEEYHSLTTGVALVDALILALSEKMQSKSAENLVKVQKLKQKFQK